MIQMNRKECAPCIAACTLKYMIRLILVLLALIGFFAVTLPLLIIFFIIRIFKPYLAARLGQPVVACGFRVIMFAAGGKPRIEGRENIPKGTPVLFAANHRSFFDIVLAYFAVPWTHLTGFISKKEMKKVPFLSWWMILLRCKFLDRSNAREGLKTIQDAIADVKAGHSMFIMPEGTRNQEAQMLPFKPGSLKIAERTSCPVVPVAIVGTDDLLEKHFPRVISGPVTIRFGQPIPLTDLSREERSVLHETVQAEIQKMLDDISAGK